MTATDEDRAAVRTLLGREPEAEFEVVTRDADGAPVVIRNAPLLDDGTPMPTRYWLVGRAEVLAVSRLEAAGGVREAEAAVPPEAIADAHVRYAAERDRELPDGANPRPTGGVGGTQRGVKCLHAHYAWHLAGGDDAVGRWVADRLAAMLDIDIAPTVTTFRHAGRDHTVPIGPTTLLDHVLADPDPPAPAQLTNALGVLADHLDDVIRADPGVAAARDVRVLGDEPWHLAQVERGGVVSQATVPLDREAAEDLFRTLATEARADRLQNPGLEPGRVDTILGTCCVVLAVMRRLRLDRVVVGRERGRSRGALMVRHPSSASRVNPPTNLHGRRVILRPLRGSDFAEWSEVRRRNDAWLTPWEPRRPVGQLDPTVNRDAFAARCAARDRDCAAGLAYGFGVFVDRRLVGEINLNHVLRGAMQSATVGYWIDQDWAGQGLVAEGVVVLAEFAFQQLDLHRLEICIVPRNANSRRVMDKLGVRSEGVAERFLEINGIWEDHVRYGFTVEEWTAREQELRERWL